MITEMFRSLSYDEYPINTDRVRPPDDDLYISQDAMIWVKIGFIWLIPLAIMAWSVVFLIKRKRR